MPRKTPDGVAAGGPGAADSVDLVFSQSLDGIFFMMLEEPIDWAGAADTEALLDEVFARQRVTRANEAMLAQYRASGGELLGMRPMDLFRHDLPRGRALWRELFDRGRLRVETEERTVDGEAIWIEGDYICLYDEAGRITGHFGIQRDVSERRRQAEELERRVAARTSELQQSAGRLRAVVAALPDLVMVVDEEGRYVEILTAQESLLYRTAEQLEGKRLQDVLPPAQAAEFVALVERTLATGAPQVIEYELTVPAGDRWFEGRSSPLDFRVGGRRCIVFLARDVTDRKRAEALETQNLYLQEELAAELRSGEIVGVSRAMEGIFKDIALVAPTDSTVLLLGETGTGKELVARAIHEASPRRGGVMVKVNCGALPAGLAESELFGHERGAFTGATQQKKGRFELAHRGTLFLDEIGELPLDLQVKLLRVLQERELERVGGTRTIPVDVRVVAATHRDLQEAVQRGEFRADLFYRLNIFPVKIPPLRERAEDVPVLAEHFVRDFSRRIGRRIGRIHPSTHARLAAYDWPGNVRELANVLERAVILCQGSVLQPEHVGSLAAGAPVGEAFVSLEEMERRHVAAALEATGGVVAGPRGAARLLGLKRSTLQSRMRKLGLVSPEPPTGG